MKKTRKLLGVFLTLLMSFAIMNFTNSNDISAAPIAVDTMGELSTAIQSATQDTTIELSDSFDVSPTTQTSVTINHSFNITIEGKGTMINGNNLPSNAKHLAITNNGTGTLTFQNITFTGKAGSNAPEMQNGGLNFNKGNYAFDNVTISNNRVGVNLSSVAYFKVNESTFINNYSSGTAASAINAEGGVSNLEITQSSFVDNFGGLAAGYASGAIWIKAPKVVSIDQSYFKGNTNQTTTGGAAIAFTVTSNTTDVNITNSYFDSNAADSTYAGGSPWSDGGAIYYYANGGYFSVDSCTFVNNYAHDDGGAMMLESTSTTSKTIVSNSTFVNNHANGKGKETDSFKDYSSGGAIQVSINSTVDLVNNTFYGNKTGGTGSLYTPQNGGAIGTYTHNDRIPVINSLNNIFLDNKVLDGSSTEMESDYANVHATNFNDSNSIGVDNGTSIDSNLINA